MARITNKKIVLSNHEQGLEKISRILEDKYRMRMNESKIKVMVKQKLEKL